MAGKAWRAGPWLSDHFVLEAEVWRAGARHAATRRGSQLARVELLEAQRYSYWSASSTLSRAARRAGRIAASMPAMTATIVKTTS